MSSDTQFGQPGEADPDAAQGSYVAQLLKGFNLVIADASCAAIRQALETFSTAALLDDSRPEAYLGLALCHTNLGDHGRGLRYFDLCLRHGFGQGTYATLRHERDAEEGSTQTYEIGMDAVLGWRATCHLELGSPEAAKRELASLSPNPPHELRSGLAVLRGRIMLAEGDLAGAQRQLGEALAWEPGEPDAHFLRGQLHESRGAPQAALRAYTRAISLDPEEPDFRIARAGLLMAAGRTVQALEDLDIAECLLQEQHHQPAQLARIARMRDELAASPPHQTP
ncbi:MAG: tetratricopeptide repeat protein [Thiobacillus sp.]|nr:tetratricopeptide repeat protein [Thiobacillus sp.]